MKSIKNISLIFAFFGLLNGSISTGFAQNEISLKEAIQLGLNSRKDGKAQEYFKKSAEQLEAIRKSDWLPQLKFDADVTWNIQLPTTVLPFPLPGQVGEETIIQLGRPINQNLGLTLEQKIWDPSGNFDQKINEQQVEKSRINQLIKENEIRIQIIESYFTAVYFREKITLSKNGYLRAKDNLEVSQLKLEQGIILQSEFEKALLDQNSQKLRLQKDQKEYEISLLDLQLQMGIDHIMLPVNSLEELVPVFFEQISSGNHLLDLQQKSSSTDSLIAYFNQAKSKRTGMPSLSMFAGYTRFQLADEFDPFLTNTWFSSSNLGLKLSIPFFQGGKGQKEGIKFGFEASGNAMEARRYTEEAELEFLKAKSKALSAWDNLRLSKENYELSGRILNADQTRFNEGQITFQDLKLSIDELELEEAELLNNLVDFLRAALEVTRLQGFER